MNARPNYWAYRLIDRKPAYLHVPLATLRYVIHTESRAALALLDDASLPRPGERHDPSAPSDRAIGLRD